MKKKKKTHSGSHDQTPGPGTGVPKSSKPWMVLEKSCFPFLIEGLLWAAIPTKLSSAISDHLLTGATISVLKILYKSTSLFPAPSPMVLVLGTPQFFHSVTDPLCSSK